jgi:hypothetical protein
MFFLCVFPYSCNSLLRFPPRDQAQSAILYTSRERSRKPPSYAPRKRVPAGAVFNAEFIINIWDDDNEPELLALFEKGIRLLENDYLGGSGSRGYGQIKFGELVKTELSEENHWTV